MNTTILANEAPKLLSENNTSSVTTELFFVVKASILAGVVISLYALAWI